MDAVFRQWTDDLFAQVAASASEMGSKAGSPAEATKDRPATSGLQAYREERKMYAQNLAVYNTKVRVQPCSKLHTMFPLDAAVHTAEQRAVARGGLGVG